MTLCKFIIPSRSSWPVLINLNVKRINRCCRTYLVFSYILYLITLVFGSNACLPPRDAAAAPAPQCAQHNTLCQWIAALVAQQLDNEGHPICDGETLSLLRRLPHTVPRGYFNRADSATWRDLVMKYYKAAGLACGESMLGGIEECFVSTPPFLADPDACVPLAVSIMLWPRTDVVAAAAAVGCTAATCADFATMLEELGSRDETTPDDRLTLQKLGRTSLVSSFERPDGRFLFSPGMMAATLQHIQFGGQSFTLEQFSQAGKNVGGRCFAMVDSAPINTAQVRAWVDAEERRCAEEQEDAQYEAGNQHLADMFAFLTSTLIVACCNN